jgi:cell division GTPase FtsZ
MTLKRTRAEIKSDTNNTDDNRAHKNNGTEPEKSAPKVQIDEWIINSPEKVKIIGCGSYGNDLVERIFTVYTEKLIGLKYKLFDKPTKPDYLDMKLIPDYRNIRAADIKREAQTILLKDEAEEEQDTTPESNTTTSINSNSSEIHNKRENKPQDSRDRKDTQVAGEIEKKNSILNKLFKLLSPRTKASIKTKTNDLHRNSTHESTVREDLSNQNGDIDPIINDDTARVCPETRTAKKSETGMEKEKDRYDTLPIFDSRDEKVLKARKELEHELGDFLTDTDLLIIITDMKSTFGLDNSLLAGRLAKRKGIITVGLVLLPERLEKLDEVEYDNRALQSFRLNADIIIAVPHLETLIEGYLVLIITEMLEIMTTSGLINLDVADIRNVVGGGNIAMLGFGAGIGQDKSKVSEAISEAVTSPLLDLDLNGVTRTLVNVTGDETMTVSEAQRAAKVILEKIQPGARLIWGAAINPRLSGAIKVMVMVGILPKNILVHIYANS